MMVKKVLYRIEDTPSFPIMILAGAQHVLTLFGATTLVPLIFGPAMGMDKLQTGLLISCVYLAMGISTLIQTHPRLGTGLPIVQGSSFSFIPPVMTIIGMYQTQGANVIMQYLGGALIVGGIILALLGYSGLIGHIRRFITPVVIGPTIMAIGFSLAPVAIDSASGYWPVSLMVFVLIILFSLISKNKYANIFAILSSIIIIYFVCLGLSRIGIFDEGHPAYINLSVVNEAVWLRDFKTVAWVWGIPKFSALAIGAMLAGFFAVMIESIGDYHSCSYSCGADDPDEKTIARGIGAEGICCALSGGVFGGVGTTSYTENIGLINLTGVASRNVVRTGAVILILMSFIGKLGALIATMPGAIIGGAYIALFGTIGALGIQVLMRADMSSQRNILIVGFAFLMSLGLPGWVDANKALFMPEGAGGIATTIGGTIWALLKTQMAVAGLCAAICDNLVPGTPEERGIRTQ